MKGNDVQEVWRLRSQASADEEESISNSDTFKTFFLPGEILSMITINYRPQKR